MRGPLLDLKQMRRLLKRPDVRVMHLYDVSSEVSGPAQVELVAQIEEFFKGCAHPKPSFALPTSAMIEGRRARDGWKLDQARSHDRFRRSGCRRLRGHARADEVTRTAGGLDRESHRVGSHRPDNENGSYWLQSFIDASWWRPQCGLTRGGPQQALRLPLQDWLSSRPAVKAVKT
jgi:hypothetical protein